MTEKEKTLNNSDSIQPASAQPTSSQPTKPENGSSGRSESGLSLSRPPEPKGEMQVSSYASAGLRPIASSKLEVFATILNNRPITTSPLQVVSYAGNRPIFASEIIVRSDFGGRPVAMSNPKLLQASGLPGGRPIASNEIDDGELLMGFLD